MPRSFKPGGMSRHHPRCRITQGERVYHQAVATTAPAGPVLVATKLYVPTLRPGMVPRAGLVARLAAGDCKLVLVCAPAGWGKTSVLSEWHAAEAESRPFAWVSLDPTDGDPVRFWSYVIGALRTVAPAVGEAALAALRNAPHDVVEAVLPSLINELAMDERRLVLVLDDYHLVRDESIHASVAFLLRHLPATVQVAIASRADPPLPLGSMRAAGEVTEVRAAQLRFSDHEAEALLNGSLALELEQSEVALLQERTEGWAAGLQLAGLSLREQHDPSAFVRAFAGDDRQIGDYLQEVIAGQSGPLREFLLQTSILERLCASLCDAVTGTSDGLRRLEEIQRANLFLVPLDNRGHWFRYHHLFRDLLRHEFARAQPALNHELHRRACAWHRAEGDVDDAIRHATAAGDFDEACDLIARHWRPLLNLGHADTIASWIDALPREAAQADARVCLARAWTALLVGGRVDEMEEWTRAAESAPLPGPFYDGIRSVEANAAVLRQNVAGLTGDVAQVIAIGKKAVSLHPDEDDPGRAVAHLGLAFGLYFVGDPAAAGAIARESRRGFAETGWEAPIINTLSVLALCQLDQGQVDEAEATTAEAEGRIAHGRFEEAPFTAMASLARGRLHEMRGDLVLAESAVSRSVLLARRGGVRLQIVNTLVVLARLKRRLGAHDEARALAREARQVLAACADPGTLAELLTRTERALQLTAAHQTASVVDPDLSEREVAILRLLASELSQREIGSELYVSFNTVKSHTRTIFRKLGVSSRAEAVARGRELGYL
jgi:LuxR family maltose regulon positive regulatory protein